jgi:hypothetical protein
MIKIFKNSHKNKRIQLFNKIKIYIRHNQYDKIKELLNKENKIIKNSDIKMKKKIKHYRKGMLEHETNRMSFLNKYKITYPKKRDCEFI